MPEYQSPDPQVTLGTVHAVAKKKKKKSLSNHHGMVMPETLLKISISLLLGIATSNLSFSEITEIIGLLMPSVATFTTHIPK